MNEITKKNVLFISTKDYDLDKNDPDLEKKFRGLSERMNVYILARGHGRHGRKYGVEFFLTPKYGTVIWIIMSLIRGLIVVRELKIDVIICQAPLFDGFVGACLKLFTGRKLVVEAHSDWIKSLFFQHKIPFPGLAEAVFIRLARFSLMRSDTVRTVSHTLSKQVKVYAPNSNIIEFPAFIDTELFRPDGPDVWQPKILYAGVLYRLKGVQYLIEAFGEIAKRYPEFTLVIAGDGPYRPTLEAAARRQKHAKIEYIGWLDRPALKKEMSECTCLVLPSLSEGLGLVLIEAASLGKPLVGSDTGGIPEVINDGVNGFLVEPGNVKQLTQAIIKIISDRKLARAMGEAGKKLVRDKFALDKYFENYFKMVDNL